MLATSGTVPAGTVLDAANEETIEVREQTRGGEAPGNNSSEKPLILQLLPEQKAGIVEKGLWEPWLWGGQGREGEWVLWPLLSLALSLCQWLPILEAKWGSYLCHDLCRPILPGQEQIEKGLKVQWSKWRITWALIRTFGNFCSISLVHLKYLLALWYICKMLETTCLIYVLRK